MMKAAMSVRPTTTAVTIGKGGRTAVASAAAVAGTHAPTPISRGVLGTNSLVVAWTGALPYVEAPRQQGTRRSEDDDEEEVLGTPAAVGTNDPFSRLTPFPPATVISKRDRMEWLEIAAAVRQSYMIDGGSHGGIGTEVAGDTQTLSRKNHRHLTAEGGGGGEDHNVRYFPSGEMGKATIRREHAEAVAMEAALRGIDGRRQLPKTDRFGTPISWRGGDVTHPPTEQVLQNNNHDDEQNEVGTQPTLQGVAAALFPIQPPPPTALLPPPPYPLPPSYGEALIGLVGAGSGGDLVAAMNAQPVTSGTQLTTPSPSIGSTSHATPSVRVGAVTLPRL